jgi:hypothetical protein
MHATMRIQPYICTFISAHTRMPRSLGVRTVQAERALRFYDDMAQRRIEPDMVTYEALLKVVVPGSTRSTREYPMVPESTRWYRRVPGEYHK